MSLLVNGKAYDWADVNLFLPGLVIEPQEISYEDELEKELAYGLGSRPRGYGRGNYKATGKLSLLRDDYDALLDHCKQQGTAFFSLEFPKVVVSYANEGDAIRQDVLNRVSFTKRSNKAAQGDKNLKVDLDLMIAGMVEHDGVKSI